MDYNIKELSRQISGIKEAVLKLRQNAADIPAVDCNIERILASIKMLEINISDIAEL